MHKTGLIALAAACVLALGGCARTDAKNAYTKGCELLSAGETEAASQSFVQAIDAGYFVPESFRGKGIAEMTDGNFADAAISLEKSLLYVEEQSEEFQRDTKLYLAFCRERQGSTDKAMALYNELILKSPDAETLFLRGKLNLRLGNNKEARADFDQAVSLSPGYDLYINIYQIYEDAERSGDGAAYLEMALSEASRNAEDYYERGLVNYYLQNYNEAKDMLISATRKDPDDGRAVFLLGKVYLASNDIADARAIYKEYVTNEKTAAGAYNGLALCDIADGDYDSAMKDVEAGLAVGDEDAEQGLLFNEIVLYEQLRDWSTAKQKAAAFVTKYPSDEAGMREYDFLSTR